MTFELTPQDLLLRAVGLTEGIQEVPSDSNSGAAVERILKRTGLGKGYPWCAAFVSDTGRQLFGKDWPLPITASCDVLLEAAIKANLLVDDPSPAAVFLLLKNKHDAVHTGFVTNVLTNGSFGTIEGNTNSGGSRDGYGVFKRTRAKGDKYVFIPWWGVM